jgi:hypothetical protein
VDEGRDLEESVSVSVSSSREPKSSTKDTFHAYGIPELKWSRRAETDSI